VSPYSIRLSLISHACGNIFFQFLLNLVIDGLSSSLLKVPRPLRDPDIPPSPTPVLLIICLSPFVAPHYCDYLRSYLSLICEASSRQKVTLPLNPIFFPSPPPLAPVACKPKLGVTVLHGSSFPRSLVCYVACDLKVL